MPQLRLDVTAGLLAAAILLAGWIGRRQTSGVVLLILLSLVWLTVDHEWEGRILVTVTATHGLTLADLFGVGGLLWAAGLSWLRWRRR